MKRFTPMLDFDDYGYPYVKMQENSAGKYVLAEAAFAEAGYEWDFRTASWMKKDLTPMPDSDTVKP